MGDTGRASDKACVCKRACVKHRGQTLSVQFHLLIDPMYAL